MVKNQYISTKEAAEILDISRVAVFKRIKNGSLPARKVGRNFVIDINDIKEVADQVANNRNKKGIIDIQQKREQEIKRAVKKTVADYGETLRLLGKE